MALGDGIRRNIAHVDPAERALLRDALVEMNNHFYPGTRIDPVSGARVVVVQAGRDPPGDARARRPRVSPLASGDRQPHGGVAAGDQPAALAALLGLDAGPAGGPERQPRAVGVEIGCVERAEWKRRRRNELLTTETLEKAIAAPAMTGLSRPSAASGSAATL